MSDKPKTRPAIPGVIVELAAGEGLQEFIGARKIVFELPSCNPGTFRVRDAETGEILSGIVALRFEAGVGKLVRVEIEAFPGK